MNRWRNTSQSFNLCLWQKSRELIFKKDYITDWTTQWTRQPHDTEPTALSKDTGWPFQSPLVTTTRPTLPVRHANEQNSPSSHLMRGMKKNQTVYSQADLPLNRICGLANTKKPNAYTQCSFPRRGRQVKHYLKGFPYGLCTLVAWALLHMRRHVSVI